MPTELNRTRGQSCVSDLRFDRMFAGELGGDETRAIDAHVAGCAGCRARRQELEHARAFDAGEAAAQASALYASASHASGSRASGSHASATRRGRPFVGAASAALALAAVAAGAWLALAPGAGPGPGSASELRFKGGHGFGFYVQRGAAVYRGGPGEQLLPGDRLRFVARTGEPRYLAVLSLDGAQHASVYYPGGERAAQLGAAETEQALPASVRLDAVLGPERLHALFCAEPLPLAALRAALEREREAFSAPPGCELETLLVHKAAAP